MPETCGGENITCRIVLIDFDRTIVSSEAWAVFFIGGGGGEGAGVQLFCCLNLLIIIWYIF